jgi:two-component system sensor histidine kinase/response regulator
MPPADQLIEPADEGEANETLEKPASTVIVPAKAEPSAAERPVRRHEIVLVVEDNHINSTLARALLAKQGLPTEVACNGLEAVEMTGARGYSAIIMDCQMPVMDGFEASRQIRAAEGSTRVPIIAVTALTMPGDRERCLEAGMDDYLTKPLRGEELEAVMRQWLPSVERTGAKRRRRRDQELLARRSTSVLDAVTVAELKAALSEQDAAELMTTFLDQVKTCVAELASAVSIGDSAEVRRVAHFLKGSSASLGAERLRACCQALEHAGRAGDSRVGHAEITWLHELAAEASAALCSEFAVSTHAGAAR